MVKVKGTGAVKTFSPGLAMPGALQEKRHGGSRLDHHPAASKPLLPSGCHPRGKQWRGSPAEEKWDPEEQVFVGAIETPAPSLSQQNFPVAMR